VKHSGLIIACLLMSGCSRVLINTQHVGTRAIQRTMTLDCGYKDETHSVLRLSPALHVSSESTDASTYRRNLSLRDKRVPSSALTAGWVSGCLAGPLLYLTTGYFDFFALWAIGPAILAVTKASIPLGNETRYDSTVVHQSITPSFVAISVEGSGVRARKYSVTQGTADLYLSDLDNPGPSNCEIRVRLAFPECACETVIPITSSDVVRARGAESTALGLWRTVRGLKESGRYAEACSTCGVLLRDFASTALVARDSDVAGHLGEMVQDEADRTRAARFPLPSLLENAQQAAADDLLTALDLDVLSHFKLSQYDTDLKKSVFKRTDEYAQRLAELKEEKRRILSAPYYVKVAGGGGMGDYDTKRGGFTVHLGTNIGILAYDTRAPKSVSRVLFPNLPTQQREAGRAAEDQLFQRGELTTAALRALDMPGVYDEQLFLSMTEEQGLAIEENREAVAVYIFFKAIGTKTARFEFRGIMLSGADLGLSEIEQRVVVGDSVRLVVGNTSTGEVYFDRRY
jgi:hypothetical protein